METIRKTANDIYKQQNTIMHRAFSKAGFPYQDHKETWLPLLRELAGRQVGGLTDLTLAERHMVIGHFQRKGFRLFAPAIPPTMRNWKKGDPEMTCQYRQDDDSQVRMVFAMWTEMGYPPKTLRGLCLRLFGVNEPKWLDERQLSHLVNAVRQKATKKGCGVYYRPANERGKTEK